MKRVLSALFVLSLAAGTAAFADDAPADIWAAKCKGCHGDDGKANTRVGRKEKIADMTSADFQRHMTDDDIRKMITEGSPDNPKMKPFKDRLSPAEIDGLVKYIRTEFGGKKK